MKGKVWLFIILLFIGLFALLAPIITFTKCLICQWFPENSSAIGNVLISFGSGIIASLIVAFLLDASNERVMCLNNRRNKMLLFSPLMIVLSDHIALFQKSNFVQSILIEHTGFPLIQNRKFTSLESILSNCDMLLQTSLHLLSNKEIVQIRELRKLSFEIKELCEKKLQGLQFWKNAINDSLLDSFDIVIEECKTAAPLKDIFSDLILENLNSFSKNIVQYRQLIESISEETLTWNQTL